MYKITVAVHTEDGGREKNEDFILTGQQGNASFFALADGLGGHGLGEVASQIACETAIEYMKNLAYYNDQMFSAIYPLCQKNILAEQARQGAEGRMRTTLNLLCIDEQNAYWSHIGDSRTYYFDNKQFVMRTFDHSVPQMLAASGEIREKDIRFHEDRNRLLKVIGVEGKEPAFDTEIPVALKGNQQFLLCSDGFWELITEEQMLLCLDEADNPQFWLDNMLELVHRNGKGKSTDNTSAIAVWIEGEQ